VELYLHSPNAPLWHDAQLKSTGTTLPYLALCSNHVLPSGWDNGLPSRRYCTKFRTVTAWHVVLTHNSRGYNKPRQLLETKLCRIMAVVDKWQHAFHILLIIESVDIKVNWK